MKVFLRTNFDSFALIFLLSAVWLLRLASLSEYPIPVPHVHDELANILGAETFAQGKLTNPPIPKDMLDSFAEIHVLSEPTRMMKYQPAMAGFLAIGIKLFGNAYWGVVLLMSLAISASYWAIRGWIGKLPAFSMSTALLFLFKAPHYFIDSYWGGGHALLGSFLFIGALPRIFYKKQYGYIWIALIGATLLLLSRTFEGSILILSTFVYALFYIYKKFTKQEIYTIFVRSIAPIIIIFGSFLSFQLIYNKAVTGEYLNIPYLEYSKQRDIVKSFWFLPKDEQLLSEHYAIRSIQNWEANSSKSWVAQVLQYMPLSIGKLLALEGYSADIVWAISFLFIFLGLPLFLYAYVKKLGLDFITFAFLAQIPAIFSVTWLFLPHYFTVIFTIILLMLAVFINNHYINNPIKNKSLLTVYMLLLPVIVFVITTPSIWELTTRKQDNLFPRQKIISELGKFEGKHMVFVNQKKMAEKSTLHLALVRNEPNISDSNIIWAWDISPQQNEKVIKNFPNRDIWYLEYNPDKTYNMKKHYSQNAN